VMVTLAPTWKPGMKPPDGDLVLLNTTTGAVRRLPIRNATAMPGAFLPGREKVVVSAFTAEGTARPMEVDLRSGANRFLGGDALAAGLSMFPSASPDGKQLVVTRISQGASLVENQLLRIDLATDVVTTLGPPMDQAFDSWLPKGDGLLLLRREKVEGQKEKKKVIGRLSLKGEFTPIIEGDHPVLLADGKTILFLNAERLWTTCSLNGKDVKPFGDGFKDYPFATPAPDGKRLLMMHVTDAGPRPVVVDLKTKAMTEVTAPTGLLAWPTWQ